MHDPRQGFNLEDDADSGSRHRNRQGAHGVHGPGLQGQQGGCGQVSSQKLPQKLLQALYCCLGYPPGLLARSEQVPPTQASMKLM